MGKRERSNTEERYPKKGNHMFVEIIVDRTL